MGKKNKSGPDLGRSLIKDRFGSTKGRKFVNDKSMLHTTEVQDGYDWGRLNLQSVTEESSFQEFLSTAELAGTEFQAEKLNIKFVNQQSGIGLLSEKEKSKAKEAYDKNKNVIRIPRRSPWTSETTAEELQKNEKEDFLTWRRSLAKLQEEEGILLTPFEKNLEFWRQLWRVVEKSDVVVQIVDARNPLLFRCEDLEKYVEEVSQNKMNLILINKADFLTETQRQYWANYFSLLGRRTVFFSAILAAEKTFITEENEIECIENAANDDATNEKVDISDVKTNIKQLESLVEESACQLSKLLTRAKAATNDTNQQLKPDVCNTESVTGMINSDKYKLHNSSEILSRDSLIELFRSIHRGRKVTENIVTIGLVGYPNVGKSSTINALLTTKKVSVSATPGKTKHFQTLYLDNDILLCDCPGLVMPSFVYTKAEMIINGILPIDQMRDHVPPINMVSSLIPRHVIEDKYGIMLPLPMEGDDPDRCPTAEEILNSYAYNRGFMTANGQPDNPRAARYILKDFVNGKLLFANAPPGISQGDYHIWPAKLKEKSFYSQIPKAVRATRVNKVTSEDIDKAFFRSNSLGVHVKGRLPSIPTASSSSKNLTESNSGAVIEKPWKMINKHENKKKREKLRRVYAHLDQH